MPHYPKYTTTVIGAYSVPRWYEPLDRLVTMGRTIKCRATMCGFSCRDTDGSYEPVVVEDLPAHLIDDPAGQRFKHLSLISSLRPGAAMPLPSVTLPARVLAPRT
jgi:hypothetical protein